MDELPYNNFLNRALHVPQLFTPEECARILALAGPGQAGTVYTSTEGNRLQPDMRRATEHGLPGITAEHWIYQRITALLQTANASYYRFDLQAYSPPLLMEYGVGDFFSLHSDLGIDRGSTRKLSLIAFLSKAGDFDGGQLVLDTQQQDIVQSCGSALVFPAYLVHRVEPVTRGRRFTLVAWAHGLPFR